MMAHDRETRTIFINGAPRMGGFQSKNWNSSKNDYEFTRFHRVLTVVVRSEGEQGERDVGVGVPTSIQRAGYIEPAEFLSSSPPQSDSVSVYGTSSANVRGYADPRTFALL